MRALKLDMMNAYDRVEWEYLGKIVLKLGFCAPGFWSFIKSVRIVSLSVLFIENRLKEFRLTGGIR